MILVLSPFVLDRGSSRSVSAMFSKTLVAAVVPLLLCGCTPTLETPIESITHLGSPKLDVETRATLAHVAVQTQYQQTGSDEALAWLLFNGVRSGMGRSDIEKVLGEPLDPSEPPEGFPTPGCGVLDSDEFYEVGPTQQGWFCLFQFRDGKLLNYYTLPPEPAAGDARAESADPTDPTRGTTAIDPL